MVTAVSVELVLVLLVPCVKERYAAEAARTNIITRITAERLDDSALRFLDRRSISVWYHTASTGISAGRWLREGL